MSIKGIWFVLIMYAKRLIREILKAIWRFLSKKRYIKSYKIKKRILIAFLIINNIYIIYTCFTPINTKETIVVERVGDVVSAATQDIINGDVEQQASNEVAPPTVEEKICAVFGEDCKIMTAIFKAESGLKADAVGYNCIYGGKSAVCKPEDRHLAWSVDCGIAQINHRGKFCPAELLEIDKNLEVGKKILNTQGLMAWSSFKSNKHLKFMQYGDGEQS